MTRAVASVWLILTERSPVVRFLVGSAFIFPSVLLTELAR